MAFAAAQEPPAVEYSSSLIEDHPLSGAPKPASDTEQDALAPMRPDWVALYYRDRVYAAFVNDLLSLEFEDDEYPPSPRVVRWILETTVFAKELLAQNWKNPHMTSDDRGGVRLSWRQGDRELRAVVPANLSERYLYWQEGSRYGGYPNFGSATLYSRLSGMNGSPWR
jgi:hypothetical protein